MSTQVEIVADSVSPAGVRITTFRLRMPRFILPELLTHRLLSRNARSSRAVPTAKLLEEVERDPVVPLHFGRNRKGMQATEELDADGRRKAERAWLLARDMAVERAKVLLDLGVHKQAVNRLLEPYMWVDVVATATSFDNLLALRCHEDAQPEFQAVALGMARLLRDREPTPLKSGYWHLPFIQPGEMEYLAWLRRQQAHPRQTIENELATSDEIGRLLKCSTARCARVSHRPFDAEVADPVDDVRLHDKLAASGHWCPFESPAMALDDPAERSGNFRGWKQYRSLLPVNVHERFDYATLDRFEGLDFRVGAAPGA